MNDTNDLRDHLLKANGLRDEHLSTEDRQQFETMFAAHKSKLRRTKWAMGISWAIVLLSYVVVVVIGQTGREVHSPAIVAPLLVIPIVVFCYAIYLTVTFLVNKRELSRRRLEARLERIETQLRKVADREVQ